ncbi:TPA: hypothetical protein QEL68_000334 [Stenotrophomonas maltophilia]|nr:hypothetical protein [Stenotrophomonas maltophilia]
MPAGFEAFGPKGQLEVSVTSRMTRLLGRVTSAQNGSSQEPALAQGQPFYFPVLDQNGLMYPREFGQVTFSGTTMSWGFNSDFYFGTY